MQTTSVWPYHNAVAKVRARVAVLAVVGILLAPLTAYAGRITLAWDPSPTTVAGYFVYYGTSSGVYTGSVDVGNQTTSAVSGLTNGVRYYFVVKAYSTSGLFSVPSNEVNGLPVNQPPTITNPGNRTVTAGAFTQAITASDPDGDPLVYSATGLSSGLAINASTGVISGNVAAGIYAVTATASDGSLGASAAFTLTVTQFTDDPLTPGVHVMRAVHITELRTRVNAHRARYGLPAAAWTDATLGSGSTTIKAIHVTELRSALNAVYAVLARTSPTYADPTLVAGSTVIKAAHIAELRAAVVAVE